jgi:hypothetical protein
MCIYIYIHYMVWSKSLSLGGTHEDRHLWILSCLPENGSTASFCNHEAIINNYTQQDAKTKDR